MNNFQSHLDEGVLLRLLDGELPGNEARQAQKHLEACWQCRAELDELQATVADCVRYRKNVLGNLLPPPPEPWRDLYREFDRIDVAEAGQSWLSRLSGWFRAPRTVRWAISTVAVAAMAVALYLQLHHTPSVQAAALLKRAIAAAQAKPSVPHRIRIRSRNLAPMIRTAGSTQVPASASPAIYQMFQAAHYDWNDPLSARAYSEWRDLQPVKSDEVFSGADFYRIRTLAPEGEVAAASLTMRATDFYPVEGRLEFRNQDWIEFSEVSDATTTDDGSTTVAANVEPPLRRAEPSQPAVSSQLTASISDELVVLTALHNIGADLGDDLEVSRESGRVVVSGIGIMPSRQRQIHAVLDSLPRVVVQFSEPAAVPQPAEPAAAPEPAARPSAGNLVAPAIQTRLERQLGGRPEFQRFSSQLLDWNEAAMARAYALHRLAERFPAETEANLSAEDRALLKELSREHTAALVKTVANLYRVTAPVLVSMGGSASQVQPGANASRWQPAAEDVLRASHRVEVLLSELLGATPSAGPTDRLPSELLTALNGLRTSLDRCQKLVAE